MTTSSAPSTPTRRRARAGAVLCALLLAIFATACVHYDGHHGRGRDRHHGNHWVPPGHRGSHWVPPGHRGDRHHERDRDRYSDRHHDRRHDRDRDRYHRR